MLVTEENDIRVPCECRRVPDLHQRIVDVSVAALVNGARKQRIGDIPDLAFGQASRRGDLDLGIGERGDVVTPDRSGQPLRPSYRHGLGMDRLLVVNESRLRRGIGDYHDRDLRVRHLAFVSDSGAEWVGRDVHDSPLVLVVRDRRVCVGAAGRLHRSHEERSPRVGDIDDPEALEVRRAWGGVRTTGSATAVAFPAVLWGIDRTDQEQAILRLIERHVSLSSVAPESREEPGSFRFPDVEQAKTAVVPCGRDIAPETEI
jgi:hypothetical protein